MEHIKLKLICLLYICIFTSCAPLYNYAEDFPADNLILLGEQDGYGAIGEDFLSDIISSSRSGQVFDKIYNCEDIYVRLRITLHIFYYVTVGEDGENEFHMYSPVTMNEVMEDIEYAESIYKDANLKFKITSVSAIMKRIDVDNDKDFSFELASRVIFNNYVDNYLFLQDASDNPDSISIFYALSIGDGISGLSIFPWSKNPYGVQIVRNVTRKYVFAHEIGHYFGLYHTFQYPTDYVEDTPYGEITMDQVGTDEDPNQYNIMSYPLLCDDGLFLTQEQISRVKAFLTTSRNTHVMLEGDEDFLLLEITQSNEERVDFLIQYRDMLIEQLVQFKRSPIEGEEAPVENGENLDLNLSPSLEIKCKKCCQH